METSTPEYAINASSIFSSATGFIKRGGFSWTCNPYIGCTFGCLYCYAMYLPSNRRPKEDWGKWFQAKINAIELARKQAKKLAGQAVYMSSVTDPYIPIEKTLMLSRGILEALQPQQPRLLVHTRGPLVVRYIDVLEQFRSVRVNVSIPTDSEEVRLHFEPKAPPLEKRWEAMQQLKAAGIPVGICLTPLLPVANVDAFVEKVVEFNPTVLVTQDFHNSNGGFGANTSDAARAVVEKMHWTVEDYCRCRDRFRQKRETFEAEAGFFPPPETPNQTEWLIA